jgi:hypothetical protein
VRGGAGKRLCEEGLSRAGQCLGCVSSSAEAYMGTNVSGTPFSDSQGD